MGKKQIPSKETIQPSLTGKLREKYRGKHVMVVDGKIFAARTGEEALKRYREIREKYPDQTPALAYIPKEDSLILLFP